MLYCIWILSLLRKPKILLHAISSFDFFNTCRKMKAGFCEAYWSGFSRRAIVKWKPTHSSILHYHIYLSECELNSKLEDQDELISNARRYTLISIQPSILRKKKWEKVKFRLFLLDHSIVSARVCSLFGFGRGYVNL